jgi:hypothetical protein
MRCHEFESRLQAVLDARRDPEQDRILLDHARVCDDCYSTLLAQRRLLDLLRCTLPPASGDDAKDRLVAVLEAEARRQRLAACVHPARTVRTVAPRVAVLAASLLSVGLAMWLANAALDSKRPVLAQRPASSSSAPRHGSGGPPRRHLPAVAIARRPTAPMQPSQGEANLPAVEAASLPWHPADLLLEAPRLPEHWQTYRPAVDELVIALPQVAQRLDVVDAWAPGLRPLRMTLVWVWEALWPATAWGHHDASEPKPQTGGATAADARRWA